MELGLNGKIALATGASRRIGAAISAELAREGVHLRLVARDPAMLREVADRVGNPGASNISAVRAPDAGDAAVAAFGRLDIR